MIKTVMILAVMYGLYRSYMRIFREKKCSSCGKHIGKEAVVCHYCNIVQSTAAIIETASLDQDIKPRANLLRSPLVLALLALSQVAVAAALYFLLFR